MNRFDKYFNLLMEDALGLVEDLDIEGIGVVKAKTDTGNSAYNVLHGIVKNIQDGNVTFETVHNKEVTMPYEDSVNIHIGSGNKEERPVVKLNISINGKRYDDVPFSIADRSESEYQALLGEDFIKANGGLVDVRKED